jgi:hypothetical protein
MHPSSVRPPSLTTPNGERQAYKANGYRNAQDHGKQRNPNNRKLHLKKTNRRNQHTVLLPDGVMPIAVEVLGFWRVRLRGRQIYRPATPRVPARF